MSEPTPKRSDPSRPAVSTAGEKPRQVANLSYGADPGRQALEPAAKDEVVRPKSSPVISKSYRVRELPPPPIVAPPKADRGETNDAPHHDTLPDGLARRHR